MFCRHHDAKRRGCGGHFRGVLFKHFPSKAALYAEILAEECEADPDLAVCWGRTVDRGAGATDQEHGALFRGNRERPDEQEAQRLRLMITSHSKTANSHVCSMPRSVT